MKTLNGPAPVAALLAFNGGFVDAAGFLGLQGLFVAHVTGNFVTQGERLTHILLARRQWMRKKLPCASGGAASVRSSPASVTCRLCVSPTRLGLTAVKSM